MRKTDLFWQERIRSLVEGNPRMGDKAVYRELEQQGKSEGRNDCPAERTIRRIREEFQKLPEAERHHYRLFSWPGSMMSGDLPWEASAAALELLHFRHKSGSGRPSTRVVKWFWRAFLAAPDASLNHRYMAATRLAALEVLGKASAEDAKGIEWFLAYAEWRSEERKKDYTNLTKQYDSLRDKEHDQRRAEAIPPFVGSGITFPTGTELDSAVDALAELQGGLIGEGMRAAFQDIFTGSYRDEDAPPGPRVKTGRGPYISKRAKS